MKALAVFGMSTPTSTPVLGRVGAVTMAASWASVTWSGIGPR
jgi:TRAP-type mannitol/chloroaromatic compound transport system permease large subunit